MTGEKTHHYEFDDFQIDVAKRRLLRGGEFVAIKPKAFDLLAVLVENNGKLLAKDELFRLVWGDQVVEETNLTVSISAIRRALGEKAKEPKYITNVSGRGYYFNAELRTLNGDGNGYAANGTNGLNKSVEPRRSRTDISHPTPQLRQTARSNFLIAAIAALILIPVAGYFLLGRKDNVAGADFGALSVKKITTTGRVPTAVISSDGKWFAFTQMGPDGRQSLWVSQTDGGGQVQLRPASEKALLVTAFAPDSSKVYYVQYDSHAGERSTLFRLPAMGGTPEKLLEDVSSRPGLSPDGKEIAFIRRDHEKNTSWLMTARLDGSGETQLAVVTGNQGRFTASPTWSPDGRRIAYGQYLTDKVPGPMGIFTCDANGDRKTQATKQEWNAINTIAWTKNSDSLIVSATQTPAELEHQIWNVALPSGEVTRLLSDSNSYLFIDLVDDNSKMLAIQQQSLSNVWVAPANDLAAAKQVTFDMMGRKAGWIGLDWTNDGKLIYTARLGKSDSIWEMNADGSSQNAIFPESGVNDYPSLPDDSSFIVFGSNRSGKTEIWRAKRDGSDPVQLTRDGDNENPHVSPNGEFIVYKSGRRSEERLSIIPAKGGDPVRLTEKVSDFPRFSPDGRFIACRYEIDGKGKLAIIGINGGEPIKLFDVPETANFRLGVRWTPDGKAVTYRDWQNGIWKQPLSGGEPTRLAGLPAEKLFAYAWSRDGKSFAFSRGMSVTDVVLLSSLK